MRALLLAGVVAVIGASAAHASYIGDTITGTLAFGSNGANGGQYWPSTSIVAPGTFNYSDGSNTDSAAFTNGTTLTVTDVVGGFGANGFGMTFKDVTNAFTSVSLASSNFAPGLTSSFADGVISVNWTGTLTTGVTYTAVFNVANAATAVPEPASLALLGMGVAGIAAVRRRRAA